MIRGSCLCGGVRFQIARVTRIAICHCGMCRKASGSAFEAGAIVASEDFRLLEGEGLIQGYRSTPGVRRCFCRICGSRAPSPSSDGAQLFVPAGLLEDDPGVRPDSHAFVGSKAPWWEISDDLPQYEASPPGDRRRARD